MLSSPHLKASGSRLCVQQTTSSSLAVIQKTSAAAAPMSAAIAVNISCPCPMQCFSCLNPHLVLVLAMLFCGLLLQPSNACTSSSRFSPQLLLQLLLLLLLLCCCCCCAAAAACCCWRWCWWWCFSQWPYWLTHGAGADHVPYGHALNVVSRRVQLVSSCFSSQSLLPLLLLLLPPPPLLLLLPPPPLLLLLLLLLLQPKTVLVPPMFERDLKARSRMVKSSYDYLFAKPSLRCCYNMHITLI
jgi:hypothetical protein